MEYLRESFDESWMLEKYANTVQNPVPFAGTIKDGETVKIECLDW